MKISSVLQQNASTLLSSYCFIHLNKGIKNKKRNWRLKVTRPLSQNRGASLLTYAVPQPREWLNACHIPPRVCLRCISCLEYLLAIYGITYVQPCNSISMVEKISLYFKLELVSFHICQMFQCLCLCWLYCNLLSITSCRSLEFSFFASINDMQSMVHANNGVYYGLKVVFACLHISLSPSS